MKRAIYATGTSQKADIFQIIHTLMEKGMFLFYFSQLGWVKAFCSVRMNKIQTFSK